jgi:hypothetical protein
MLLQIGFSLNMVKWIMACVSSAQMAVLIIGSAIPFFKPSRGLRQGFSLSPYLFFLITEGLSRCLKKAKSRRLIKGVAVGRRLSLTHLLFIDDFYYSALVLNRKFKGFWIFCNYTVMEQVLR